MPKEHAAGFILYRTLDGERQYLIVRNRGRGYWGFPKGRLEPAEASEAAARREVAEEVGITRLEKVPCFREVLSYSYMRCGTLMDKEVVLYLARAEESGEAQPGEIQEIAWLPYAEARAWLTHAEQRELLRRAEACLAEREGEE